jgi:sugar phosphate isomerase/epimerase
MQTRRDFILATGAFTIGSALLPSFMEMEKEKIKHIGLQLYTFRKELLADAMGTLKQIASLGIKQIESASSDKGHYYGLTAKEMKQACKDLGMKLRSGHVHIDDKWQETMNEVAESGQEYVICSSMPTSGQTVDNYKKAADAFNKAGEECKKLGLKFGYHNHDAEFEKENGQVLYDILLDNTQPDLVHMEMDLGWVIVGGYNPLDYFAKYPGRFPLWHLKDMDVVKKHSVEFGKGQLDIAVMLHHRQQAGVKHIFIEQEEFATNATESIRFDLDYLDKLKS